MAKVVDERTCALFRSNWQHTLTYWSVFFSFGLCIAFLGPTVLDLRCQTHSTLQGLTLVFFAQQFCLLMGSSVGGFFSKSQVSKASHHNRQSMSDPRMPLACCQTSPNETKHVLSTNVLLLDTFLIRVLIYIVSPLGMMPGCSFQRQKTNLVVKGYRISLDLPLLVSRLACSLWSLAGSTFIISAVFAFIPVCANLPMLAVAMAIAGLAMGVIDTISNLQLVKIYQKDSTVFLQALHFFVGLGALVSPLIADPFLSEMDCVLGNTTISSSTKRHLNKVVDLHNMSHVHFHTEVPVVTNVSYAFWIMALINLPVPIAVFVLIYRERLLSCWFERNPRLLDSDVHMYSMKGERSSWQQDVSSLEGPEPRGESCLHRCTTAQDWDSQKHHKTKMVFKWQSEYYTEHSAMILGKEAQFGFINTSLKTRRYLNLLNSCPLSKLKELPLSFFGLHLLGGLVLFFSDGIVGSYTGFVYTYAVAPPMSLTHKVAGYLNSVFWASITLGRLASIALSCHIKPVHLLTINQVGVIVMLFLLLMCYTSSVFLFVGTCFLGLFISSVYPCMLALTEDILDYKGNYSSGYCHAELHGSRLQSPSSYASCYRGTLLPL
ncbi:hypothetical protein P4O66_006121 [Electrophorus voltai]|uniref:Uncharacterized protein n=1 Tax=Electrophorus voltai TaxID=2609070 RepID=A0AAD9DZN1_9TELE|nr:hypothetical protein P4O66_006121 [Electrophorus voltai]